MRHAIGLDLGGSSAKIALVAETGEIRAEASVAMPESGDAATVLAPIAAQVDHLQTVAARQNWQVLALGCGFSGYLDPTRTVIEQNNTPALNGFALASWLRHASCLPIIMDNDACVAAFAETHLTPVMNHHRILFATIGSGIGVVLVVNGEILRVMKGVTGDASHLIVDANSRERCPLGCAGCLETVATARALARVGSHAGHSGASPLLAQVLRETGEIAAAPMSRAPRQPVIPLARRIVIEAGRWLGVGLASWACIYAPDLVLLGGAVAQAGDAWLQSATVTMREVGMPLSVEHLVVARCHVGQSRRGDRGGVDGAPGCPFSTAYTGGLSNLSSLI